MHPGTNPSTVEKDQSGAWCPSALLGEQGEVGEEEAIAINMSPSSSKALEKGQEQGRGSTGDVDHPGRQLACSGCGHRGHFWGFWLTQGHEANHSW